MNAVDTNVLIDAQDPREAQKQAVARDLNTDIEEGILLRDGDHQPVCDGMIDCGVQS